MASRPQKGTLFALWVTMTHWDLVSIAVVACVGCGGAIAPEPAASDGGAGLAFDAGGAASFGAQNGATGAAPVAGPLGGAGAGGLGGGTSTSSGGGLIVTGSTDQGPPGPPPKSQAAVVTLAAGQTCPWGMAIDATSVYWTNCGDPTGGYVLKVPKAGGEVVALASGDRLSGIAVGNGSVYWVAGTSDASSGAIVQIPVGGGTATTLAARPGPPAHIAVDSTSVYWTEQTGGAVMKVAIAGGAVATVATASSPWSIALGDTDVFWMGQGVMSAPKVGGTATALTSSFPTLPTAGLAVNATNVYFTSGPPAGMSGVSRVSVQGGAVTSVVAGAQSSTPGPIAIDGTRAYWADGSNSVFSALLSGGTPTTLAIDQNNVVSIAVDATAVYWLVNGNASTGQGAVMKLPLSAL
ncbi:MAG: hypothetical protein ACLP1X_28315 [Polyangiaceae bacterium]